MKKIKTFSVIFSVYTLLAAVSCSILPHKHAWSNFIVKQPTCTEKGLLEKLCEECGEKEYEDINPSGHNYQNGACTICGTFGYADHEVEPIPMPEDANNMAALTWEKLYNIKQTVYYEENFPLSLFMNTLSNGSLTDIYLDTLGLFHTTAAFLNSKQLNLEIPIIWSVGKVSPINPKESKFGTVSRVHLQDNQMIVTYNNGIQTSIGSIQNSNITITGFGLNTDNEFIVYYSDNTIAFVGNVSSGKPSASQADFIYSPINGGYELKEALSYNSSKTFKIPVSHQGKPIVSIADNAFEKVANSATSIIVPNTITNFTPRSFSYLTNKTSLYFEDTREDSPFNGFIPFTKARIYFKGEWSYVNGVPTPNN